MELISEKDKELACGCYVVHLESVGSDTGSAEHAQFQVSFIPLL